MKVKIKMKMKMKMKMKGKIKIKIEIEFILINMVRELLQCYLITGFRFSSSIFCPLNYH